MFSAQARDTRISFVFPPCVLMSRGFQCREASLQGAVCEIFDAAFFAAQAYRHVFAVEQWSNWPPKVFFRKNKCPKRYVFMISQFVEHTHAWGEARSPKYPSECQAGN